MIGPFWCDGDGDLFGDGFIDRLLLLFWISWSLDSESLVDLLSASVYGGDGVLCFCERFNKCEYSRRKSVGSVGKFSCVASANSSSVLELLSLSPTIESIEKPILGLAGGVIMVIG